MTLLIAIKVPSRELNPRRRPLCFTEPGIVMAADTRFSWTERSGRIIGTSDNAQKGWPLGDRIYGIYAGDAEVAERAIFCTRSACNEHNKRDNAQYTLSALHKLLKYFSDEVRQPGHRTVAPTVVVVGMCLPRARRPKAKMFLLSYKTGFQPEERDGLLTEGTGSKYFTEEVLDREIDEFTRSKSSQLHPRSNTSRFSNRQPAELIDVSLLSVAGWIAFMADRVILEASLPTVGGQVQLTTIGPNGIYHPHAIESSDSGSSWRQLTRHDDFQGHTDMRGSEFIGPLLDKHCNFRNGSLTKVRTTPGRITGWPRKKP